MKAIFAILWLFALFGVMHAGTVILTGTCGQTPISENHSYNSFSLLNSGNETATDLILVPDFSVGNPVNLSESIPAITPGQNITEDFYFRNLSMPGSYAGSYGLSYTQGASSFFTTFPCIINVIRPTVSLIRILSINVSGGTLTISLANVGESPISANVSLILPQSFHSIPQNLTVSMSPSETTNVSFAISHPKLSNVEYPLAAYASFALGGLHYATLGTYTLNLYAKQGIFSPQYLIFEVLALVMVIMISLIAFSIFRKRNKKGKHEGQGDSNEQTLR